MPTGRQVWQQLQKNGKETPQGSFLKYTAHEFLKTLKQNGTSKLYEVNAANKKHEIWQRDSLSIEIGNMDFAKQKIDYIHFNLPTGRQVLLVVSGILPKIIWIIIIHLPGSMRQVWMNLGF